MQFITQDNLIFLSSSNHDYNLKFKNLNSLALIYNQRLFYHYHGLY